MAIITKIPNQEVIATFKGKVDFYLWKGMPCARIFPAWKLKVRAPQVQVYIELFKEAMTLWPTLPADIRQVYDDQAVGSGLSGRDWWVRAFISGIRY